ncbi:hypothetical protein MESS2_810009 [Mesorhizobium metallidurans STM 2683]|uniref:Uncharacterized protein n=1 Tax=Mesorhizobium metallidurans STM 2683 TaxID=1297569 RepID=M5EYJ1_9HYPH|nr:hypothetical protein MESS2_810009 [Mesorhizobium metallidurans STM 2683]
MRSDTGKGLLQTAAFASQRYIKRGRPFVVGQTGSKQSRTCGLSASINFQPLQSAVFVHRFTQVTVCSAHDDFGAAALHLNGC